MNAYVQIVFARPPAYFISKTPLRISVQCGVGIGGEQWEVSWS